MGISTGTGLAILGASQAGSGILSGILGSNAASSAASAELSYLNKALQFQEGVYNTAQTNLNPWITGGQEALGGLETFLGLPTTGGATAAGAGGQGTGAAQSFQQFTQTPYYTFPLGTGIGAMNASSAARGLGLSIGQVAQLGNYASGYASSNFMNYINALNSLSGVGQTASSNLGQIGTSIAQSVGNTAVQQASAAGSGILGSAAGTAQAGSSLLSGLGLIANAFGGAQSTGSGSTYGSNTISTSGAGFGGTSGTVQGIPYTGPTNTAII